MEENKALNEIEELISVIIPVYNVEKYLNNCMDSILRQTYSNLEIILIDDGSTDASAHICDSYADEDARVKVIHKRNSGAGAARNDGMELAKGIYIVFIDSDDYVGRNYIEGLYYALKMYHADISVCECTHISEESDGWDYEKLQRDIGIRNRKISVISGREVLCGNVSLFCGEEVPWGRLYKKSIFSEFEITFPVGLGYEDTATIYKTIYYANRIACIDMKEYYYRIRDNSLMHSAFSIKNLDRIISQDLKSKFYFERKEHEMLARNLNCYCKVVRECYNALQEEYHGEDKRQIMYKIIQDLRNNLKLYSREKIGFFRRLYYLSFAYLPCKSFLETLYCWIVKSKRIDKYDKY